MPDDFPVTLRDYLERVLKERERTFYQFMEAQKEAIEHLRTEARSTLVNLTHKIDSLESRMNRAEGAALGKKGVWGYVLAIVGFALAAAVAVFNRYGWPHQ
jgi:hypothetical protein